MAIRVYEKHGSPDARFVNPVAGNSSTFAFTYVVLGTSTATAAVHAVSRARNKAGNSTRRLVAVAGAIGK